MRAGTTAQGLVAQSSLSVNGGHLKGFTVSPKLATVSNQGSIVRNGTRVA